MVTDSSSSVSSCYLSGSSSSLARLLLSLYYCLERVNAKTTNMSSSSWSPFGRRPAASAGTAPRAAAAGDNAAAAAREPQQQQQSAPAPALPQQQQQQQLPPLVNCALAGRRQLSLSTSGIIEPAGLFWGCVADLSPLP